MNTLEQIVPQSRYVRRYSAPSRTDIAVHPGLGPAQNYSSLEGILLTSILFHDKRTVPAPPWPRQKSIVELSMARQMETDCCGGGIYPSLSIHLLSLQIDYGMVQQFAINIPLNNSQSHFSFFIIHRIYCLSLRLGADLMMLSTLSRS